MAALACRVVNNRTTQREIEDLALRTDCERASLS